MLAPFLAVPLLAFQSAPLEFPRAPLALEGLANFDVNGDGLPELARVKRLQHEGAGPCVVVLVEARLASAAPGELDLAPNLERLAADLAADGYTADVLAVALAPSTLHQDGRYVLALRELLRFFAANQPLAGALLVGHFPDALLVRTVNWRMHGDVEATDAAGVRSVFHDVDFLRRVPELVAHRADIVLSDLDGHWEDVYFQPTTRLASTIGVFADGVPEHGGPVRAWQADSVAFRDFFLISDGKLERFESPDDADSPGRLWLDDRSADNEVSAAERQRPNALARPDIVVSRIDARGTAISPRRTVLGVDGLGLFDADGMPRCVEFGDAAAVPDWRDGVFEYDPVLERQLLAEYLDRNHEFRTQAVPVAFRPASLACELGSGYAEVTRASSDWASADAAHLDVHGTPGLTQVAAWLAEPALLRTVRAHSDGSGSVFRRSSDLDEHLGGPAWSWSRRGTELVPSLEDPTRGGRLDWFLLNSLWRNHAIAPQPSFYLHTGCEIVSPPGASKLAFDDPAYGRRQAGEALLFFGQGLALVGRAKVFYDEPRGFCDELAAGGTFGAAWARYFEEESRAPTWGLAGGDIGRKRAYFWSVLGDWTLRLGPPGP